MNIICRFICATALLANLTASAQTWIWYPGQLSAYMQDVQKRKSSDRCVNVGYPGNFEQACPVIWVKDANGIVERIDGDGLMPAKWVEDPSQWQVSLDGKNWNMAEYDPMLTDMTVRPDAERDIVHTIFADGGRATEKEPLTIDFGELEVGTVSARIKGSGSAEIVVGECIEEALCRDHSTFEQKPIATFALTDEWQDIALPERALRYIAVFGDAEVDNLRFDTQMWPVELLMTFECSDSLLNNMFEAGVKTMHTSMHNFYLDGIKRDYLPWAMDAIVTQLAGDFAFGDRQVARNGIALSLMPHHATVADLGIVDYPLHALIGLKHYCLRYGESDVAYMFRDRIMQQLKVYDGIRDSNGFICAPEGTSGFIPGWNTELGPDSHSVPAYAQMMLYENYRIASWLGQLWGDNELESDYSTKAANLRQAIISHFWDEGTKAFINGYDSQGNKDRRISHQAQYWAVLTDMYPEEHFGHLFDKVIPSIPYYKTNISYEKGYEAGAYQKAGRMADYRRLLADIWGDWLRDGNARFPENFFPGAGFDKQHAFYGRKFGLSLCHGANGAPPVLLALLGIFGFAINDDGSYSFSPDLMGLDHAKGRFPVKEGIVTVDLRSDGNSNITIPATAVVKEACGVKILRR